MCHIGQLASQTGYISTASRVIDASTAMETVLSSILGHFRELSTRQLHHKQLLVGFLCTLLMCRVLTTIVTWVRDLISLCLLIAVIVVLVQRTPKDLLSRIRYSSTRTKFPPLDAKTI